MACKLYVLASVVQDMLHVQSFLYVLYTMYDDFRQWAGFCKERARRDAQAAGALLAQRILQFASGRAGGGAGTLDRERGGDVRHAGGLGQFVAQGETG